MTFERSMSFQFLIPLSLNSTERRQSLRHRSSKDQGKKVEGMSKRHSFERSINTIILLIPTARRPRGTYLRYRKETHRKDSRIKVRGFRSPDLPRGSYFSTKDPLSYSVEPHLSRPAPVSQSYTDSTQRTEFQFT